jgi:hypothetical protein
VAVGGGDGVADGDLLLADEDLADEQPHDLLALLDRQLVGVGAEAGAEAVERLGQLEVGLGVVELVLERVQLGL